MVSYFKHGLWWYALLCLHYCLSSVLGGLFSISHLKQIEACWLTVNRAKHIRAQWCGACLGVLKQENQNRKPNCVGVFVLRAYLDLWMFFISSYRSKNTPDPYGWIPNSHSHYPGFGLDFLHLKNNNIKKKDKDKHSTKLYRVVDGFNLTYLTGSLYVNVLRLPGTYCFDTHWSYYAHYSGLVFKYEAAYLYPAEVPAFAVKALTGGGIDTQLHWVEI